jgi:hypothetical protein
MKNSLTDAEIEFFAEEIKKDYVNVLKEFTTNPANQEEKLISDVTLFIEGLAREYGSHEIFESGFLYDFSQMKQFANDLLQFKPHEIKDILIKFLNHKYGDPIASELIGHIEGHISDTDFNNIVTDNKLSHLY